MLNVFNCIQWCFNRLISARSPHSEVFVNPRMATLTRGSFTLPCNMAPSLVLGLVVRASLSRAEYLGPQCKRHLHGERYLCNAWANPPSDGDAECNCGDLRHNREQDQCRHRDVVELSDNYAADKPHSDCCTIFDECSCRTTHVLNDCRVHSVWSLTVLRQMWCVRLRPPRSG